MNDSTEEIKIACPHCGQHIIIDETMLGMELECPTCKQPFVAELPVETTTEAVSQEPETLADELQVESEVPTEEISREPTKSDSASDGNEPKNMSDNSPDSSELRQASSKFQFVKAVKTFGVVVGTSFAFAWTWTKRIFLRFPQRVQGAVLASVVFLIGIAVFSGKCDYAHPEAEPSSEPSSKTSFRPSPRQEESVTESRKNRTETEPVKNNKGAGVWNPTEAEKQAMGKVFYVYAKYETLMSQLENQIKLAASQNGMPSNEAEVGLSFLKALSGANEFALLNEVDTSECPKDFADAWKEFATGVSQLKLAEGVYKMMTQAFSLARMRGQPIDRDFAAKLLELERNMPEIIRDCEEKMKRFAAVCQKYGLDNLQQWAKEAYIMNEGNPDAKLFKFDNQ